MIRFQNIYAANACKYLASKGSAATVTGYNTDGEISYTFTDVINGITNLPVSNDDVVKMADAFTKSEEEARKVALAAQFEESARQQAVWSNYAAQASKYLVEGI